MILKRMRALLEQSKQDAFEGDYEAVHINEDAMLWIFVEAVKERTASWHDLKEAARLCEESRLLLPNKRYWA